MRHEKSTMNYGPLVKGQEIKLKKKVVVKLNALLRGWIFIR